MISSTKIRIVCIFENKLWEKLDKAGLVGKILLQSKTDYKEGGIFMDCS